MTEIDDRISQLCILLAEDGAYLRESARLAGAAAELSRILAAIRNADGQTIDEHLVRDLDALDRAMAHAGHGYVTHSTRTYQQLPRRIAASLG
jgi:hypothetical protein